MGNANTAYLDLSFLYGSDEETALNLRATNEGRGGVGTGATGAITPFDHDKFYKLSAWEEILKMGQNLAELVQMFKTLLYDSGKDTHNKKFALVYSTKESANICNRRL